MRRIADAVGEACDDHRIFADLTGELGVGESFTRAGASSPGWSTSTRPGGTGPSYPWHLVVNNPATRLHSQFDHASLSAESKIRGREPIRIHPSDAAERGIRAGDNVLTLDIGTSRLAQGCTGQHGRVEVYRGPVLPVRAQDGPRSTANWITNGSI